MNNQASVYLAVLRGVAIIGVVTVHSLFTVNHLTGSSDYNFYSYILGLGKYGVELFFFISGLLMYSIYGFDINIDPRIFFRRRFARIYPLWIIFLLLSLFTHFAFRYGGISDSLEKASPGGVFNLATILFMGATFTLFLSPFLWNTVIPGGWSIQAEVFHYVAFVALRKKSFSFIFFLAFATNSFTSILMLLTTAHQESSNIFMNLFQSWIRLGFYSSSSFFLTGVLAGYIMKLGLSQFIMLFKTNTSMRNSLTSFFVSLFFIPTPFGKTTEALGVLVIFLIIGWALTCTSKVKTFFISFGEYSYFIYFCHFLILDLIRWLTLKNNLSFVFPLSQKILILPILFIVLTVCWILGKISMKYLEKPFIEWARLSK